MIYGVYCMHDKSAKTFGQVSIDTNDMTARRNFAYAVNNSDSLSFMAKDFDLYKVAIMDSDIGAMTPVNPIVRICAATDVIGEYT